MPGTALVVAGGDRPAPQVIAALPPIAFVVAADGGADHALAIGLAVDVVVGDLDSISDDGLAALRRSGAEIERHPADKDDTDLELALARAAAERPDRIVVIGLGGGRLDHTLANHAVLASNRYGTVPLDALLGSARLSIIKGSRTLHGRVGEIVSLLPMAGRAVGVTTEGLQYPLRAEPLEADSARGISNRFTGTEATITVDDGVLLAVQPYSLDDRADG